MAKKKIYKFRVAKNLEEERQYFEFIIRNHLIPIGFESEFQASFEKFYIAYFRRTEIVAACCVYGSIESVPSLPVEAVSIVKRHPGKVSYIANLSLRMPLKNELVIIKFVQELFKFCLAADSHIYIISVPKFLYQTFHRLGFRRLKSSEGYFAIKNEWLVLFGDDITSLKRLNSPLFLIAKEKFSTYTFARP